MAIWKHLETSDLGILHCSHNEVIASGTNQRLHDPEKEMVLSCCWRLISSVISNTYSSWYSTLSAHLKLCTRSEICPGAFWPYLSITSLNHSEYTEYNLRRKYLDNVGFTWYCTTLSVGRPWLLCFRTTTLGTCFALLSGEVVCIMVVVTLCKNHDISDQTVMYSF